VAEMALPRPDPQAGAVAPVPARGLRHAFRAMRHRDFALFFAGAFISNTGMWMQNVTVPFVLYQATGKATWVGLGAFLQFIPALLVGGVGGVFADRFPRRRILLVSQSVNMAVALALWAAVAGGQIKPGLVLALVALAGLSSGFGIPAWQSLVPDLVPREHLLNAVALNSAQFNATRAIGFMVGGLTLARYGPEVAFAANGLSYLAVLAALLLVRAGRTASGPGERVRSSFRLGLTYTRQHTGLLVAVATVGVVAFLGSPVVQLAPVFARDEFHVGEGSYGLLAGALGTGATLGSVLLGAYGDNLRRSRMVVVATTGYGLAVVGMGVTPSYAGGVLAMFLIGLGYLVVVSALNTSVQMAVDDRYRGRVLALYGMAFVGAYPFGSLLQGALADIFGVRPVVAGAGLLLVGYAAWLLARPDVLASFDGYAAAA
jgi:MFS family permease